jgi:ribosomal protein S1
VRSGTPEHGTPDHGVHTLRVWRGTVVGRNGRDVFVELGPRMQGVLRASPEDDDLALGAQLPFTLGGQEEGLWVLSRAADLPLASWERAAVGDLVEARLVAHNRGGFEAKVGAMHGFLPFSESGLGRREDPADWLFQILPCEVLDVDPERQRVYLSHRRYVRRSEWTRAEREAVRLRPGAVVKGRVDEFTPFGAFIDLGRGARGLLHRSNISYERVRDPAQVLTLGQVLELQVLSIRADGLRIGLGLKQRQPSPWRQLPRQVRPGDLLRGEVVDSAPFGVFVRVRAGVVGLVPLREAGLPPGRAPGQGLPLGTALVVRVLAVDAEHERLSLSLLRADGSRLDPEELLEAEDLERLEVPDEHRRAGLGRLLHAALERRAPPG